MSFGQRLSKLRLNNNVSVRELAKQVGVTASFIYQLEQDKVSPSYSTLRSISNALDVSASILVDNEVPEQWILIRKSSRNKLVIDQSGVDLELPQFLGARSRKMTPIFFNLKPGAVFENTIYTHECEYLVYGEEGTVIVEADGRKVKLSSGDLAYFVFESVSQIENPGDEPARGIIIVTPPGIEESM